MHDSLGIFPALTVIAGQLVSQSMFTLDIQEHVLRVARTEDIEEGVPQLIELLAPIVWPALIGLYHATVTGRSCREYDNIRESCQQLHKAPCVRVREMLGGLKGLCQIEPASRLRQVEHIDREKAVLRTKKLGQIHPSSIDAENYICASLLIRRQPSADSTANIYHGLCSAKLQDIRDNLLGRP
jgi:hypothetical protein